MYELINSCFDERVIAYFAVTKYGAKWISVSFTFSIVFNQKTFKKAVKYLFDNSILKFSTRINEQIIGISLKLDPAALMANLFLRYYDDKWIQKTNRNDLITYVCVSGGKKR